MACAGSPRKSSRGFSMIEVAIAIAVIAILAGAAAPLVLKAINQQREQKTRDLVRIAYESIAGARDRRVSNMKADFGFNPPVGGLLDLRFMTTINPALAYRNGPVPPAYGAVAGGFRWGWNGPYWSGSIQPVAGTNGVPLDGWGRPLRWANNRVESRGQDGVWGGTDDLVFPNPAFSPANSISITVVRTVVGVSTLTLQLTVIDRFGNASRTQPPSPPPVPTFTITGSGSVAPPGSPFTVNPGPITIQVVSVPPLPANAQSQTIDLLPGENRAITFNYNN